MAAAAGGDTGAWAKLTNDLAPGVWRRVSAVSDFGRALDAGCVVFHRLADECASLNWSDVDPWLAGTAGLAMREAEAVRWRLPTPQFEVVDGVPPDLLASAERAFGVRAGQRSVAAPIFDSSIDAGPQNAATRGVTVSWRAPGDAEVLRLPSAVWRGQFVAGDVFVDLTLVVSGGRRLIGTVDGVDRASIRLRGGPDWHNPDEGGRFRIASVPEEPVSVEVAGSAGSVVTQWRTI
jgi:hypothetical protein